MRFFPRLLLSHLLVILLAVPLAALRGPAKTREVFAPDAVPPDFGTRGGGLLAVRPAAFLSGDAGICAGAAALVALIPPGYRTDLLTMGWLTTLIPLSSPDVMQRMRW